MKVETRWHDGPSKVIDVPARLQELADESGAFAFEQADWMVAIIAAALRVNEYPEALASQIKTCPPLLSAAEKRERGLNVRLKLGQPFADCLTEKGKADPSTVATFVARAFLDEMNNFHRQHLDGGASFPGGLDLFLSFLARQQGCAPSEVRAVEGHPDEAIKLMWFWAKAMQDAASGDGAAETLRAIGYDANGEAEVDDLMEAIANADGGNFELKSNAAISVMSERVRQAMMVLTVNSGAGLPTMLPPPDMAENRRQTAIGLLWLYRPQLPFPVPKPMYAAAVPSRAPAVTGFDNALPWVICVIIIILAFAAM